MQLSIIIPTYNEETRIASTIQTIRKRAACPQRLQIMVADGGSVDETVPEAEKEDVKVVHATRTRRSVQMNEGARLATGNVLYFLHADVQPPPGFDDHIKRRLEEGYGAGCFRLCFDSNHPLLLFYGWCTRFNIDMFRFGDQSLFVKPEIFWQLDGYRDEFFLLEDQDMVVRLKTKTDFALCRQKVVASPRKYAKHGPAKLQLIYSFLVFLYKMGLAQRHLHRLYQKWVNSL